MIETALHGKTGWSLSSEQVRGLTTPQPARISAVDFDPVLRPSTKMLLSIAATGKHLYQGTVPAAVVERRRAKNRAARRARRAHRR